MGITETIVFYLLFGGGVAAAVMLADDSIGRGERAFRVVTAVVFWPLYLPLLLKRPASSPPRDPQRQPIAPQNDELAVAISQAEAELDAALAGLDGWAENVLAHEADRFAELRSAWRSQAQRVRELDALLGAPAMSLESDGRTDHFPESTAGSHCGWEQSDSGRLQQSELARLENLRRLRDVRGRMHAELLGTLARVREVVTMIHLARFTGAPASRAEELVAQIAAAVEGLTEVTRWPGEAVA